MKNLVTALALSLFLTPGLGKADVIKKKKQANLEAAIEMINSADGFEGLYGLMTPEGKAYIECIRAKFKKGTETKVAAVDSKALTKPCNQPTKITRDLLADLGDSQPDSKEKKVEEDTATDEVKTQAGAPMALGTEGEENE